MGRGHVALLEKLDRAVALAAAEADGEVGTDVARSPGGDLELLPNQSAAGGGAGGKWKHQGTAAARTWLSRSQLFAAPGTTAGGHQDPIHRFTEGRLKCGPRQILVPNPFANIPNVSGAQTCGIATDGLCVSYA